MSKTIEEQVAELKTHVDNQLEAKIKEATESMSAQTGKVDKDLKAEIEATTKIANDLQKQVDEMAEAAKFNPGQAKDGAIDKMAEQIAEITQKGTRKGNFELKDFSGKALRQKDMTDANLTGQYARGEERRGSIVETLQRQTHVRELFEQSTTSAGTFRFMQETGQAGDAGTVAPGGTKPPVDYNLELKDAPVRKIAGFVRIAEELLDDIPGLQGFISRRLPKDTRKKEDVQLLIGDGTGQNLTGIGVGARTFAATKGDTNATLIDLMVQATAILEGDDSEVNGILLNPRDFYGLYNLKDSGGQFLHTDKVMRMDGQLAIAGVPVLRNSAVAEGSYFIGDWANAAQIFDRKGLTIRFYEQDADNVTHNKITVVCEERLAFPIYRPLSYINGVIGTDVTKIKNA